jgi:hypothetical protein
MKLVCAIVFALVVTASPEEPVMSAKVVAVKKYDHGHILYWEGLVPIYDRRPVYDLTIAVDGKEYIVRYESNSGYYPEAWKQGNDIQVKRLNGRFKLINGDKEVSAQIVTKDSCVPNPTRNMGVPILPCPSPSHARDSAESSKE